MHLGGPTKCSSVLKSSRATRKGVKEERSYFEIQDGELALNRRNFAQCADLLFEGIPDTFR
jgi:hypothetical protein